MTLDDARRWAAVVRRDSAFDGHFVYCVKSTKIFCRPTCKARLARRMNILFCDTPAEAQALGYRSCKRCQPLLAEYHPERDRIERVCEFVRALPEDAPVPGLERLAAEAGLTKHHFHRLFKREVGVTPREFVVGLRGGKDGAAASTVSGNLSPVTPVTESSDVAVQIEADVELDWGQLVNGQDPYCFDLIGYTLDDDLFTKAVSTEQLELAIVYFNIVDTVYGRLLVAFKGEQVCKLELGTSEVELAASLEAAFPSMYYIHSHVSLANEVEAASYQQRIDAVVQALEFPTGALVDVPFSLNASEASAIV